MWGSWIFLFYFSIFHFQGNAIILFLASNVFLKWKPHLLSVLKNIQEKEAELWTCETLRDCCRDENALASWRTFPKYINRVGSFRPSLSSLERLCLIFRRSSWIFRKVQSEVVRLPEDHSRGPSRNSRLYHVS